MHVYYTWQEFQEPVASPSPTFFAHWRALPRITSWAFALLPLALATTDLNILTSDLQSRAISLQDKSAQA
jgi:hypothetical protein